MKKFRGFVWSILLFSAFLLLYPFTTAADYTANRRIAFRSFRNDRQNVFMMNADGSDERQLTDTANRKYDLTWSPDGSMIAYVFRNGNTDDIQVVDVESLEIVTLTDNDQWDFFGGWTPDSQHVLIAPQGDSVYMATVDGADMRLWSQEVPAISGGFRVDYAPDGSEALLTVFDTIYKLDTDGSNLREIARPDGTGSKRAMWAFGGAEIVVSELYHTDRLFTVYLLNADGLDRRLLIELAYREYCWDVSLSPDGTQLLFACDQNDTQTPEGEVVTNTDVYRLSLENGVLVQLTDAPRQDRAPAWSPDGTQIAFTSDRNGNNQIYLMEADGGNLVQLTEGPAANFEAVWAPMAIGSE